MHNNQFVEGVPKKPFFGSEILYYDKDNKNKVKIYVGNIVVECCLNDCN
jgi:hypothetical protein